MVGLAYVEIASYLAMMYFELGISLFPAKLRRGKSIIVKTSIILNPKVLAPLMPFNYFSKPFKT
jgi:hypothetical protein